MKKKWFFESDILFDDIKIGYAIKRKLLSKRSPFQQIDICETQRFGRILLLDGITQTTEKDEFIYHEMIVHVPLFVHPKPEKVLIIGGGDGGTLREVLKHPVKKAVMVEIDEEVIKACKKYLPSLNNGVFANRRAEVIIGDGFKFLEQKKQEFDIIIVDSSDPIGPAAVLFQKTFYRNVRSVLTPNGIAVFQSGLPFFQFETIKQTVKLNREIFAFVNPYFAAIPTYWGGDYAFVIASKKINPLKIKLKILEKKAQILNLKTKYYNPEIHLAAFKVPNYIERALKITKE